MRMLKKLRPLSIRRRYLASWTGVTSALFLGWLSALQPGRAAEPNDTAAKTQVVAPNALQHGKIEAGATANNATINGTALKRAAAAPGTIGGPAKPNGQINGTGMRHRDR
jgi:hypothetical protein